MKTKFCIGLLTLGLAVSSAFAQGGFGGFHLANEFTGTQNQLFAGGGGAWSLNENIYLGGMGSVSVNRVSEGSQSEVSLGYGGLMLGYLKSTDRPFKPGADIVIGTGGYNINDSEFDFFFLEPNVKIWYNFNHYMAGNISAFYRLSYPTESDSPLTRSQLSRFGIRVSINFGKFNH